MLPPTTMAPPRHATKQDTKKEPPIRTTTSAVSGNNISRTNYAPPTPADCEQHVAETNVQTACHHSDRRRRGAQPVQLSYYSQKPQIYIKTLQTYTCRCIHPREHTTNDYIQFIITLFYMNIDKMYRPHHRHTRTQTPHILV